MLFLSKPDNAFPRGAIGLLRFDELYNLPFDSVFYIRQSLYDYVNEISHTRNKGERISLMKLHLAILKSMRNKHNFK